MLLLVSGRHVGAHLYAHLYGWAPTSHSSMRFLSLHVEESIVLEFHSLLYPVSSGTYSLILGLASTFNPHLCRERGRLKGYLFLRDE